MSPLLTTQHLHLVVTIVEEGSLTRAAEKLYLSQSALSHQLKDLEARLGVLLFERRSKRLLPTPAGQQFLTRARVILAEVSQLQAEMDVIRYGERRVIRLSVECYTCYHWLPAIIAEFQERVPHVQIQIVADATAAPLEHLARGALDLAIVSTRPEGTAVPLFDDEMVALISWQHPYATSKSQLVPQDFASETFIYYDIPDHRSWVLSQFLGQHHVRPRQAIRVQLTEAIVEMVKANLGIAVLANWAVQPYVRAQQLAVLPLLSDTKVRTWYAALAAPSDPVMDLFLGCIQQRVGRKPILDVA